ncbi:hypothetical protein OA240_01750, partial [bacterium]|nr:hypothetical protein [bacterium]
MVIKGLVILCSFFEVSYFSNIFFAVYLHDQTGAKLASLSNKGDKPLSVLPLKMGPNFDQKFGY